MPTLLNQPSYQKLIATGVVPNDTYTYALVDSHSGGGALSINPNVIDFDTTLGRIFVNLPSLLPFFVPVAGSGSQGLGFSIRGTITGVNFVQFNAFNTVDEPDRICGDLQKVFIPTAPVNGATIILWISGRFNWGACFCNPTAQP